MDESQDTAAPRGSRLGKFRRRVLIALLLVAIVIAAVPTILSTAALRPFVLSRVVPSEVGTASVERLSLGWLTGIDAQGIVLVDAEGQKVLEADHVTVSRSLLNLAFNRRELGTIRIDQPTLYIVTRANGSNVEDLLAVVDELAQQDEEQPTSSPNYVLNVTEGQAFVADPELGEMWRVDNLAVELTHPGDGPLEIVATGQVGPLDPQKLTPAGPSGDARLVLTRRADGQQEAELTCDNLPLAAARPWLRRWDHGMVLTGIASGKGEAKWTTATGQPFTLAEVKANSIGRFDVINFRYVGSAVGNRPLDLPEIRAPWNLELAGGQLTAKQLEVSTDAGSASISGAAPIAAWGDWARMFAGIRATAEGDVSLARLSQLAPELIPLREGAAITDGNVNFRITAEPDAGALRVLANLETSSLAGQRNGRVITWDAPLRVRLAARQFDQRLLVESANVQSEFAQFALTGDRRQMHVNGSFDLDRLADRLGEFVDMSGVQLAGTGQLRGAMQLDDQGHFTAGGGGSIDNLVVRSGERVVANESHVAWQVDCQGQYDAQRHLPNSFSSGQLTIEAGSDEMVADLTGRTPLANSIAATMWPIQLRLVGDMRNWQRRLRPFVALDQWQLDGRLTVDGSGQFRATPLRVALADSKIAVENLAALSSDWNIREQHVEWTGDLEFDLSAATLASRNGQFVGSTVAASLRNWMWTLDRNATKQAGGELAVRTDLTRLAAWQRIGPDDTSRIAASGQLVGNVTLSASSDELRAALDIRGDNVTIARVPLDGINATAPPKPMQVAVTGEMTYRPTQDELVMSNLRCQSQLIGINAQGKLAGLQTRPVAEIVGTVDYDLAQLTSLFVEPSLGPDVKLVGRERAEFRLNGPLPTSQIAVTPVSANSSELNAYAAAPWQSASVFGLPIGGGKLEARLTGDTVDIRPLDFAVGGGRLTAAPRMLLSPAPAVLTLPSGPLLTDVTITPDVSNRMLKFIAPVLDQATQTEGKFSVLLDGATVPLADTRRSTVAGQLAVKSVRVGPGPRIQPLVQLATEIEAISKGLDIATLVGQRSTRSVLLVRDRTVDFRLVDGRVYHQGLEFQVDNIVVRSSGSVGLDETLDLVFDIPIQDQWIADNPLIEPLRGRSIQVPIHGTFAQKEIDRRPIDQLVRDFVRSSANRAIDEGLNRALNRLFGQ